MRIRFGGIAAAVLSCVAVHAASAVSPADKCESGKLKVAGKYDSCRLNAEAKAASSGGMPDFSKCDTKFADKWTKTEAAGGGMCPSNGDAVAIQAFITQHADDLAGALAGGTLPDCSGDLVTCTGGLASCNGTLGACNTNLATCATSLSSCTSSLTTVNAGSATQADVLSGKTFSSAAGIGASGTMPNNGAVSITPGTSAQVIAAGYHNGAGMVAGDADLAAANIKYGVTIFGVTGSLGLTKTGQTTSFGPGSDGDVEAGTAPSYTDNGDGTITDNVTGLMWEKKNDDGGLHDKDNLYTGGMTGSPYTMDGTMVTVFLAALNSAGGFAGHTDWRIPNYKELTSILNLEANAPAVSTAFHNAAGCSGCSDLTVASCSCTRADWYWTSTAVRFDPSNAWIVHFSHGAITTGPKNVGNVVRAVRGGL